MICIGGKGGKGHCYGEPGSTGTNCTTGGTAGVDPYQPSPIIQLFCGTGGFSHDCTGSTVTDDKYAGDGGKGGNGSYGKTCSAENTN